MYPAYRACRVLSLCLHVHLMLDDALIWGNWSPLLGSLVAAPFGAIDPRTQWVSLQDTSRKKYLPQLALDVRRMTWGVGDFHLEAGDGHAVFHI